MKGKMSVLFAASECVPFAKTGGLADVIGALPEAIAELGYDVRVVLPYYKMTREQGFKMRNPNVRISVPIRDKKVEADILEFKKENVTYYFIQKDEYYERDGLYQTKKGDHLDNAERFIFFSKAVLALTKAINYEPDIIHCHDWQTGLIPALIQHQRNQNAESNKIKTVYTIHNLAYQGLFWHFDMDITGLPWSFFTMDGLEFYGKVSLMKSGIVFADVINTVSKKYSQEVQTPELGFGLDGVLRTRKDDLYGILNGADYDNWNPETDKFIVKNYSARNLAGKKDCRHDLLKRYKMKLDDRTPLIGVISRMADQKGFDLIAAAIKKVISVGVGFVLLGTGDKKYEKLFRTIGRKYPKETGIRIAFDNKLAHKIEAGCDMFLMASRYEPCGLNQMYSLKYGTVPIVRATGGLDDTITEYNPLTGKGNGFKFENYDAKALVDAVKRAVKIYQNNKHWMQLIKNGIACDFSWSVSAKQYVKLYRKALKKERKEVLAYH